MSNWSKVEDAARALGFESYEKYLGSNQWTAIREQKLRESPRCCVCHSRAIMAHHIRYLNLHDVQMCDLASMCMRCHDDFHLACRMANVDYLNLEIPRIEEIIAQAKKSLWYSRRAAKLKAREAAKRRRAACDNPRATKIKIRKQMRYFLKNNLTGDGAKEFCDWLMSQFGE